MDHLAEPETNLVEIFDGSFAAPRRHSFRIPYLRGQTLHGVAFSEITTAILVGMHMGGRPIRDVNAAISDSLSEFAQGIGSSSIGPSFFQSWLYFGLLIEIFGRICQITFDWHDFIDETCPEPFITTKRLKMLIYLWHALEASDNSPEKSKRLERIIYVIMRVDQLVNNLTELPHHVTNMTNLEKPGAPGYPTLAAILLSIKFLGSTICEALPSVYGEAVPREGAEQEPRFTCYRSKTNGKLLQKIEFTSSFCYDPIISQLLKRAGYCPHEVQTCDRAFSSQGNLGLRWFLTFLDRRHLPGNHDKCTVRRCIGYQLDERTYKPKHVLDNNLCGCESFSLSHSFGTNVVLACVRRGGTPLIRVDWPFVKVFQMGIDRGPTPRYVAISHVWSEGLGNPKENALPRCQLTFLQYAASRSCPSLDGVYFWIDTLCIPVGHAAERRQEIGKMGSIFSGAEKVVVIDQSLMRASSNTHREEVFIRIWRSPWASRLWTLQEARLSKTLSFFFSDRMFDLKEISEEAGLCSSFETDATSWLERYETLEDPVCYRLIEWCAAAGDSGSEKAWERIQKLSPSPKPGHSTNRMQNVLMRQSCPGQDKTPPPLPDSFISRICAYTTNNPVRMAAYLSLQNIGSLPPPTAMSRGLTVANLFELTFTSLKGRNLTKLEDESLCIATLVGLPIGPIMNEGSPERRMRTLLTSIGTLPFAILFVDSERLREEGHRWMPRTLLGPGPRFFPGYRMNPPDDRPQSHPPPTRYCKCQPDGRLLYHGPALACTQPFAIETPENYFAVQAADGKQYFVGIPPQSGLIIDKVEKIYLIIPGQPPLVRDHIPQRVVILSLAPTEGRERLVRRKVKLQARYEFSAWLFDLALPGSKGGTFGGGPAGTYNVWVPPTQHWWRIVRTIIAIPYDSLDSQDIIIS